MGTRRLTVTLAVSLALHLGLLAVFFARPQPPVVTTKPAELELVEVELPPAAPAPVPPEATPPAPTPRVVPRAPRPAPVATAAPAPVEAPPPPEPTEAPTADSPMLDVPRSTPLPLPSASLALSLDAGEPLAEAPAGLRAPTISGDLVADLTRETIGRGKVDRGLVHPYYSQLGKALLKNWDADRAVSSAGLKGVVEQAVENTKAWNNIWQEKAQVFGKTGSPFDAPVNARARPVTGPISGQDLAARKEVAKMMGEQMKTSRRAQIKVTQDAAGKLLKVELLKPSNDSNVDRQAVADVRTAAESLPPPPPEAMSGRQTLVSIWEFELVVSITPPIPTFTFEFDEVLGFIDTRMPLDRRIYKKVRLLAVE